MIHSRFFDLFLATASLLALFALAQTGPGPCHPYPGASASDCLELIGNNLNNDNDLTCGSNGRGALTLGNCTIVLACARGQASVETGLVVRRALTTIGSCALNDYGSISGYYVADDRSKTCYLYPGRESQCLP